MQKEHRIFGRLVVLGVSVVNTQRKQIKTVTCTNRKPPVVSIVEFKQSEKQTYNFQSKHVNKE